MSNRSLKMYADDAVSEKQQKASRAVSSLPLFNACEHKSGMKISRFLAHCCTRAALKSDCQKLERSIKECAGFMPRVLSRKRRPRLGLATIASVAWASSGRSG